MAEGGESSGSSAEWDSMRETMMEVLGSIPAFKALLALEWEVARVQVRALEMAGQANEDLEVSL